MHFSVRHETSYRYSVPVSLGPHVLRLLPQRRGLVVEQHRLVVEPEPVGRQHQVDGLGNAVLGVTFAGTTSILRIESQFELQTFAAPPLEGLALPPLPWLRPPGDVLWAYSEAPSPGSSVIAFATDLLGQSQADPLTFLNRLNQALYTRIDRHIRTSGDARPPEETLSTLRGACRDITLLFLATCRALGMPGRFVSGYQAAADTPDGQRHLHAWPEVHLQGFGWRGWDPTHGLVVSEGHVPLCVAPTQAPTMPVDGTYSFIGPQLNTTLDYSLRISTR
jgi:transglutaminase-like putative cysteine protease